MNGYAGKIMKVNLTTRKITSIPTSKYEQWVGGHGMGSAIFFDLCKDKTIDGFDPGNVVTVMTSPFSGTVVPGASARTEVQGIGVQSYPIGWFTRSNMGGRFAPMLKMAGWDGVVIMGKSVKPVWLDIRDDKFMLQDCAKLSLWGDDTRKAQEKIWKYVAGEGKDGDWAKPYSTSKMLTTQRSAVMAIGPAGENRSRLGAIVHDASSAAGQGGFGGVWGSKNLKAISVIGTGGIHINDPKALMKARMWMKKQYAYEFATSKQAVGDYRFDAAPSATLIGKSKDSKAKKRPKGCEGCHSGCRPRYDDGHGNEATCMTSCVYSKANTPEISRKASDLVNQYGINAAEIVRGYYYLVAIGKHAAGKWKIPACPLDFSKEGSLEFFEQLMKMLSYGNSGTGRKSKFGKDLLDGIVRAVEKWGLLEDALKSGALQFPYWGLPVHKSERAQVHWSFGTILGDRDINEHCFDWIKNVASTAKPAGKRVDPPAEKIVKIMTDKMVPYQGDMQLLDFSAKNMYSDRMVKLVSWHRFYTRFWKQSMLFCDARWPDFYNSNGPGNVGSTGIAEPKFMKAVTGKDFSFEDGIKLGQKIWNLDHAIWTLQGRHRRMVKFADALYDKRGDYGGDNPVTYMPGTEDGRWDYYAYSGRTFDREKFEEFKTKFYKFHKWDPESGYPTKAGLKELGLDYVATELFKKGKLGKG
jgi:aldehyde:ferredoxin oxidoreductase